MKRLVYIDLLRGVAALAVVLGHVRAVVNLPWGEAGGGWLGKFWVGISCHHHTAVVVFFVLSGYMVGGGVLRNVRGGAWSWGHYVVARLTRLYVVLVPALAFTWVLDVAGRLLAPEAVVYQGHGQNGMTLLADPAVGHSWWVFGANILFLQDLLSPVFGTNGSLWSLSYEFWYYLLFPCVLLAWSAGTPRRRILHACLAVAIGWLIGVKGLTLMIPWLAGVAVAGLRSSPLAGRAGVFVRLFSWAVLAAGILSVPLFKDSIGFWGSLIPAAATCLVLWTESRLTATPASWLNLTATKASEISYTLYATHLPLVVMLHALWLGNQRLAYSPAGILTALAVVAAVCGFAGFWWWLFERRTDEIRNYLKTKFLTAPR